MLIVDGQIHLWEKGTPSPQHRQEPYSAEQAIAAMDEAGVDRALVHPVLWDPDSNELAQAAVRVRRARRLRGLSSTGLRSWWAVAVPHRGGQLDRSIELAAAMDARGFGRIGEISRKQRRLVATGVLAGLLAIVVSVYEILDVGSPVLAGVPLLVAGTALAVVAVVFGGRHRSRTTYRPAAWRALEWVVLAAGAAAIAGVLIGGRMQPGSLHTTVYPLAIPQLPWPTLVGIALALLPVVVMSTARNVTPQFRAVRGDVPAVARR